MNKQLKKLASKTVSDRDVEALKIDNAQNASQHPWAYTQRDEKDLAFAPEISYDPRLINAGVVHGD